MTIKEKNEKDCLEMCLSLSDDAEFQKRMRESTHEQRVVFLLDNGFSFDHLTIKEAKELEKIYRSKAKKQ